MPQHVVVDGSNIATEGRSMPSLTQLQEAVLAFIAEYPDSLITVVVDATFGHRIDPKELAEFDEGVNNNELVAPPAGAVGRGDAFVLSIANKVGATILTNDSFQEFHGDYPWLFDEGRLIGGKPVPHIGWVFVPRVPVRGLLSRKSMQTAKRKAGSPAPKRQASKEASLPMPVPTAPPPGPALRRSEPQAAAAAAATDTATASAVAVAAAPARGAAVNDLLPFLTFVEQHPVGSSVNAVVESYSSHGAYVRVGDVKGYIPLRLMADPTPRSARDLMKIGDAITVVVESFAPARRSIDLAVPTMATAKLAPPPKPTAKRAAASKATGKATATKDTATKDTATRDTATKSTRATKATTTKATRATKRAPAKEAPARPKDAAPLETAGEQAASDALEALPSKPAAPARKRATKRAALSEAASPAASLADAPLVVAPAEDPTTTRSAPPDPTPAADGGVAPAPVRKRARRSTAAALPTAPDPSPVTADEASPAQDPTPAPKPRAPRRPRGAS